LQHDNEAIHNKDYSVVKTSSSERPRSLRLFLSLHLLHFSCKYISLIVSKHETFFKKNTIFAIIINRNMRNTDFFRQYIWTINTILSSRKISFSRIQSLWIDDDLNDHKPLSRTTFYRLREDIENMFGIHIECDRSDHNQYYISNPEALKDNSTQNWMLQTLTVGNTLADCLSIKDRLVLEEIPAGMEYLPVIIKAMKKSHVLLMTYQKFGEEKSPSFYLEPYCLKVFRQRWYLLGNNISNDNPLQFYAFDRIIELKETNQTFTLNTNFQASNYLKDFFGVFVDISQKPMRIVLRAYGKMIDLLRTLPKHHSQREIATTAEYAEFEYYLVPSLDFKHDILREGPDLEVLEPESFRNEIQSQLREALDRYHKKPRTIPPLAPLNPSTP